MALKKQIQAILASDYRGPKAGYGEIDVLKAMFAIGKSETNLGRLKLGQLIGLGQGEIRTLISRLKESGLIVVDSSGCSFTDRGKREFDALSRVIPYSSQVQARGLNFGKVAWAVIIRDKEGKVRKGLEQRDASIRAGATGALTVVYSAGGFKVPSADEKFETSDCETNGASEPWTTIRRVGNPRDGDVIIVSAAESSLLAEEGALAAALTLL